MGEGSERTERADKEANQKLQEEKVQIAYNYGLNIVQNMSLREKVAKANELVSQLWEEFEGYTTEIVQLRPEV